MKYLPSLTPLLRYLLLSIAFGAAQPATGSENDEILSCKTPGVFLSLNRTLAPLERVTSSDDTIAYATTDVYNFGYGEGEYIDTWCTTDRDSDPYIEMELTSPVLITQILFSGRTGTMGLFYATNLTLEYSPLDNNTIFHFYTTETGCIKYFAAPYLNTLVPLDRPLLTNRIRLRPVEWFVTTASSFEYICLGVGLYGCLATNAAAIRMGIETTHTTPDDQSRSPAQSAATTDSEESESATQTFMRVVRDYQTLGIVLPIALLTIIINALLIGVSVYVCVILGRRKESIKREDGKTECYESLECSTKSQLAELNDPSAPASENPLSKEARAGWNDKKENIIKMVDNSLYGISPDVQPDAGIEQGTSVSETGYEPVEYDKNIVHEPVKSEEEEMVYSLIYSEKQAKELKHRQDTADIELSGNYSYNSFPSMSIQDEDEEGYVNPYYSLTPSRALKDC